MDFVWDDFPQIVYNPLLDNLKHNFFRLFTENLNTNMPIYFRPVFTYSLALDTFLWGKDFPAGFHLTNILLNSAVVTLCFFTLLKLEIAPIIAFISSIIFAVHPIHNEVVALISARNELLSALFILSSFLVYMSGVSEKVSWFKLILSSICYFLALLSKENAIFIPLLILLYERLYLKSGYKEMLKRSLPFFTCLIVYFGLRYIFLPLKFGFDDPLKFRILTFITALLHYVKTVFYPINLKVFYGSETVKTFPLIPTVIFMFLSFLTYAIIVIKKDRRLTFLFGWFILILLPASNLFTILRPAAVADRYNFLPSLAIITIFTLLTQRLFTKNEAGLNLAGKIFYTALIFFLSMTTINRNWIWENYLTFATEMVKNAPSDPFAYNNLGICHSLNKNYLKAEEAFKKTLQLKPGHEGALYGLGRIYYDEGRYEEAAKLFKQVVNSKPIFADAYYYLGESYLNLGLLGQAENVFLIAIKLNPYHDLAYDSLGDIYLMQGKHNLAVEAFKRALKIAPHNRDYEQKLFETQKLLTGKNQIISPDTLSPQNPAPATQKTAP